MQLAAALQASPSSIGQPSPSTADLTVLELLVVHAAAHRALNRYRVELQRAGLCCADVRRALRQEAALAPAIIATLHPVETTTETGADDPWAEFDS